MTASIYATLTPQQISTQQAISSQIGTSSQSATRPTGFTFVASFDGTNNDRNDLARSGTSQETSVAVIDRLVPISNPNIRGQYYPGPGTAGTLVGSSALPVNATEQIKITANQAYDDFVSRVVAWKQGETADSPRNYADVTAAATGFSRGSVTAIVFAQILNAKGLVIDGQEIIPPGQLKVSALVLFDPVSTGYLESVAIPGNVDSRNTAVILAQNEYRQLFPADDHSDNPAVQIFQVAGNHGDVGGFYDRGLGALVLSGAVNFLRGAGIPLGNIPANRTFDPLAATVIHNQGVDTFGNRIWNEVTTTSGDRVLRPVDLPSQLIGAPNVLSVMITPSDLPGDRTSVRTTTLTDNKVYQQVLDENGKVLLSAGPFETLTRDAITGAYKVTSPSELETRSFNPATGELSFTSPAGDSTYVNGRLVRFVVAANSASLQQTLVDGQPFYVGSDGKLFRLGANGTIDIADPDSGVIVQGALDQQSKLSLLSVVTAQLQVDGSYLQERRTLQGDLISTAVVTLTTTGRVELVDFGNGKTVTTTLNLAGVKLDSTERVVNGTSETLTFRNGAGELQRTVFNQNFDEGPALRIISSADGSEVRQTGDFSNPKAPIIYTSEGTAPPMQQFGSALQDINSIVQQIRGGASTGLVATSGLRLLNNQVNPVVNGSQIVNNAPLFTTTAIANGFASIYSIDRAFSTSGNYEGKLSATLNGIVAINAAANAVQGAVSGTVNAVASQTLNGVASSISSALPFVNIALAIKSGDPVGIGVAVASAMGFPVIGWIYAAYQIITAITSSPPEAWGVAKVTFSTAGGTSINVDVVGDATGPGKVKFLFEGNGKPATDPQYFGGLLAYLNETMARQQQANPDVPLGIIPQRLPTISWRESRLSEPGYSITDINPLTGEEIYPNLRYNDNFLPYNADALNQVQRRSVFERMIDSAVARQAIAPLWEVQTARMQQDQKDPNAGLTEEQRAGKRGELAAADASGKRLPGVFRPIVLDLNGDKTITTISDANSNVKFDWDDTGFKANTGWVGAGEGLLVIDRNANGQADSGRELFSNGQVNAAARGVRSMSWVDGNGDGVLDASDPVFNALRVWQDADSDGVQDAGETKTLSELGITKLDYGQSRFTRNGQDFAMQSPDIEATNEGVQAYTVQGGIQINHSNGSSTLLVSGAQITSTGGGTGQGTTFTVTDEGIDSFEDGLPPGDVRSKDPTQRQSISIYINNTGGVIGLLDNDKFNGSSAGLTISSVGSAQNGSVVLDAANGLVVFTPNQNFNGIASFNYTVLAPDGQTRMGHATLNLAAVNDAPTVEVELLDRPVYGYAPQTSYIPASGIDGDNSPTPFLQPNEGEPIYEPYVSVGGNLLVMIGGFNDGGYSEVEGPSGTIVDTTVPLSYFNARYAALQGEAPYVVVIYNGNRYAISPNPPTYSHSTPIGYERNNDGRVLVSDVDNAPNNSFDIVSNPLYGTATIDSNGGFTYTGRRYVGYDLEGNWVNGNTNNDIHTRAEGQAPFNDSFRVRVVDQSDPSGQTFTYKDIVVPHYGPAPAPEVASGGKKPIAIDLDGDGFEFINVDDSNVFADVLGDGVNRRTAWVGPRDGILAFDENGDGRVDKPSEISFTRFLSGAQTDLQGLRAFDTNNDGIFSAADAKWSSFGVWKDANSNGINETGEFRSLTDLGIQSIALTSDGTFRVINGQTVHGIGNVTRTNGTTLAMADVTLGYKNVVQATTTTGAPTTATVSAFSQGQQFTGTTSPDLVFGTSGNDEFTLGDGNDVVVDDLGNDRVTSGAGDDLIYTGADDDFIDAGAGNDNVFAGNGNDFAYGGIGDDVMFLEGGNDIAFGGDGNDTIAGGIGNDLLSGDSGNDKLLGESGRDQLFGQSGDDELWGMDGDDALFGGTGNDLLVGGEGADQMEGGVGNDRYEVDNALDVIVELVSEGIDTVDASINYTLSSELENLTLTGTQALQGTGNQNRNVLVGNTAANTLVGLGGNDLLDGGEGADTLIGGTGDDTYVVDNANDQVTELAGEGVDTVQSRINYTLGANVENLTLVGIAAINGTGNAADNVLLGNDAANTLDGGLGADTMRGGKGNDTYVVENASDQVIENADEGYDTIIVNGLVGYALDTNVEALILGAGAVNGAGNALNNTLRGNAASNLLDGGAGADVMFGGAGDDIYVVDNAFDIVVENAPDGNDTIRSSVTYALSSNVEKLELSGSANIDATGNDLNNIIVGNSGNNRLDGGFGADAMTGGLGSDTYIVDNVGDVVTESLNEGTDRVNSSITYALNANVEELELTGTSNISATGNALSNVLIGNSGNNILDGGVGADSMAGGAGDDTYIVDNVGDVVTELIASGSDTVNVIGLAAYTLTDNVEALVLGAGSLDGSGNALNNTLSGNASANTLDGKAGADTMAGGAGNDIYIVDNTGDVVVENLNEGTDRVKSSVTYTLAANVEELELTGTSNVNAIGNALSNVLIGNTGNNVLDGGAGADSIAGGAGDDTYIVDNVGDVVTEFAASGTDTVNVVGLTAYSLTDNVEVLVLGAGSLDGSGNALNNTLSGNSGANTLDGKAGADTMAGGAGNDIYIVDNTGDVVVENLNEGTDRVKSSVTYTLAANVEELELTGTSNVNAIGNALSNVLIGNTGNNVLDGGAGADSMAGGAGDDTYIVDDVGDVVTEFAASGTDTVNVVGLAAYTLTDNVEVLGLGAGSLDGSGNVLNNTLTGNSSANTLDGKAGADTMAGGAGNDIYIVDNTGDLVVENLNEGTDRVKSSVTYTLAANVEELELTGTANINATGNTLSNVLIGNSMSNTLDGGAGADLMAGGAGDDTYIVDNLGDVVTELLSEGFDRVSSSIDYVLPQNVEQVTLTGTAIRATGNQLDNLLFGNAQANILDGGTGADQLAGGLGDDRYVVDNAADVINEALDSGNDTVVSTVTYALASNVENIMLTGATAINGTGNTLANVLVGNTGANTLDGGAGNDVLAGGKGNDSLIGGAGDDLFLYNQGEGYDIISDASGTDTLRFGTGITLDSISARTVTTNGVSKLVVSILGTDGQETADGVEWLLGAGGVSPIERFEFVNASSVVSQVATLAQIAVAARTVNGGNGNDTLTGDRSDDTINAGNGNDIVYGRSGNDILYGDNGADKLFGEGGNDQLYGGNDADELWGGAGNDLLDGGNASDILIGGSGDDKLYGGNDADKLDGGDGNDLLDGSNGEDELYAGAGNDAIDGGNDADLVAAGAGNDTITTGNGLDVVIAGAGDDYVNTDNDADFVDAGSGVDTILTGFGADFIAAGTGNDVIDAGGDQDIIAFNKGDGADTVLTSSWQRDTLSLGGGIKYADLSLSKVGNNLVLNLGGTDSMTFKDWYLDTTRRNITTLQVVTAATGGDFSASSTDRMKNKGVVNFNFEALVNKFDQVRTASPTLTSWPLATQLDAFYSSGSNTQALGGNLAYRYATTGSYGDLGWAGVRAAMQGLNGTTQQAITASTTVNPWVALQAGISLITDQTVGLPSPITPTASPTSDELFFAAVGASGRPTTWRGATASPVFP